ncbi:MAG: phosphoglycerate kinase [Desulfobacterales bacterium RIFOXYA12_FULL_46_15]|nr:MAG: phosphoglycerate kinase [Desulfobacterales bacterium RIFOXYA12_FULL_46_15]
MKSVKDINVTSKRVFVRVDYNVPLDDQLNITDDNRIMQTLHLIGYLINNRSKIILASHLGRPKGKRDMKYSLAPVSKRLSELLKKEIVLAEDCIGDTVTGLVNRMKEGEILLLENLRFHMEEEKNNDAFAKDLACLCDVYINEAFAVSHRDQASVTGIPKFAAESCAGFLLEKEVKSYYDSVENPKRPLVAVIGGSKVSSKLAALENMIRFVDKLIIGGAMANTFLKSQGIDTKGSMIEEDLLETARDIIQKASEKGVSLLLPNDLICAEKFDKDSKSKEVLTHEIPDNWMALDIGSKTALRYAKAVEDAGTIVWNGPMGVFEMDRFMSGTKAIADAIASSKAFSVVGGGDTGLAAKKCHIEDKVSYISTGGGAFLHMMEGKILPGVAALN